MLSVRAAGLKQVYPEHGAGKKIDCMAEITAFFSCMAVCFPLSHLPLSKLWLDPDCAGKHDCLGPWYSRQ